MKILVIFLALLASASSAQIQVGLKAGVSSSGEKALANTEPYVYSPVGSKPLIGFNGLFARDTG